ncbi:hypothetical protein LSTR_LSTR006831 [Laodelphax striatellus]|uniref:DEUBAD domain-containing protein n=1 Tax=Laodelphax striatellus TaxID=195883 RepID=A0A482XFY7_LAOST|nr:hypothetical protein LSTR_LSTR006831 [Laodelphax striatellus]
MVMEDTKNHLSNNRNKQSHALSPVKLHKRKAGGLNCLEVATSGSETGNSDLSTADGGGESDAVIGGGSISVEGEREGCEAVEESGGGGNVWSIAAAASKGAEPVGGGGSLATSHATHTALRISQTHSKKVIKHALRQQAKRRRKNTTIASGNSAPLPRILVPPSTCEQADDSSGAATTINCRQPTMLEVLSSIPGFSIKPRKRTTKKLSAAAQLEQTAKEGCIDLETPDSILASCTNLRALLNKHSFSQLPPLYQYKLVQLLPHCDRAGPAHAESVFRLSGSGLNNEFFARACQEWRERLAEGEFTPENQQKLKAEAEKEKSKLDPWKFSRPTFSINLLGL